MGSPAVAVAPRKSPSSGRRTNKPLVEKKRRARINGCLGQLKSLILSAMQTEQGAQVSRLEKADILEMTVKYLRHVQRQQGGNTNSNTGSEPEVAAKFSAGYTECATEVIRYMDQAQCVTSDIRTRLESHLVERLRDAICLPVPPPPSSSSSSSLSSSSTPDPTCGRGSVALSHQQHVILDRDANTTINNISTSTTAACLSSRPGLMNTVQVPNTYSEVTSTCIKSAVIAAAPNASALPTPVRSDKLPGAVSASPITCTGATDQYSRHYQTAVDLANMAAGVILPAQTQAQALPTKNTMATTPSSSFSSSASSSSSSFSALRQNPDPTRCKSSSPPHENKDRVKSRKRFNSTESAMPQAQCHNDIDTDAALINRNAMHALERLRPETFNPRLQSSLIEREKYNNKENYLRSFQRPLHIDIPKSPDSTVQKHHFHSINPSKAGPVVLPSACSSNDLYVSSSALPSSSTPSSSSSSSETTIYNYQDDAPPTLLYAYNYNLPHIPSNERRVTNSPRVNYSLVVYQPESEVTGARTTTTVNAQGEQFHATFALEQRPHYNNAIATNFYCAPKSSVSHAQGQVERTVQHPAALNAPNSTPFQTQTSMSQPQEFGPEERFDVNNNISSFYDSQQFHCTTFTLSQSGKPRSLRKDSTCPQIPSGFYDHNNIGASDNTIKLAPVELSSNLAARFHGNSQTCGSAAHPVARCGAQDWASHQSLGDQTTTPSNDRDTHCVNPPNNGERQGSNSLNGQSRLEPLAPHSPQDNVRQSSVPSPPHCSPAQDNSRTALKKHLLFGQRSELTRRHCLTTTTSTSADDRQSDTAHQQQTPRSLSSRHSDYQSQSQPQQTGPMTGGEHSEQHGVVASGSGAIFLSGSDVTGVSSAKRPCLEQTREVVASCYRRGHVTDDRLVWRPW
ncbi:hypothetical protein EGW08_005118 [Elysia chlorotica]|uniref:BHLH domain-containing protein n=1 Tax=Elysia chlorotica TaxID=188477 RepID=A0A433U054_ELYCH|nr:hypothetical protein EGW08_005118 [Elysia chlorotica]